MVLFGSAWWGFFIGRWRCCIAACNLRSVPTLECSFITSCTVALWEMCFCLSASELTLCCFTEQEKEAIPDFVVFLSLCSLSAWQSESAITSCLIVTPNTSLFCSLAVGDAEDEICSLPGGTRIFPSAVTELVSFCSVCCTCT